MSYFCMYVHMYVHMHVNMYYMYAVKCHAKWAFKCRRSSLNLLVLCVRIKLFQLVYEYAI